VRSGLRRETWAVQQIPRCVTALTQQRYATHVHTEQRTTDEVVEWIAGDAGLTLQAPRLAPWRYQLRRLEIGIATSGRSTEGSTPPSRGPRMNPDGLEHSQGRWDARRP